MTLFSRSPAALSSSSVKHCLHILRQYDFDRYIASLFAPSNKRAGLVAIWAFHCEMARLASQVKQPLMGEIRLRWWCDEIESTQTPLSAQNPLLDALTQAICQFNLPKQKFITACEAHMRLLYEPEFSEIEEFELYAQETTGVFFQLACQILAPARANLATTTCFHAGQFETLWYLGSQGDPLQQHYRAFVREVSQLPRDLRPAFLSLAPKSTSHAPPLSPLRRLWRISRASLFGYRH